MCVSAWSSRRKRCWTCSLAPERNGFTQRYKRAGNWLLLVFHLKLWSFKSRLRVLFLEIPQAWGHRLRSQTPQIWSLLVTWAIYFCSLYLSFLSGKWGQHIGLWRGLNWVTTQRHGEAGLGPRKCSYTLATELHLQSLQINVIHTELVLLGIKPSLLALVTLVTTLVSCIIRWEFLMVSTRPLNFPFSNNKF